MKKVIAFAAALLLVASGGSILPRGNYSVAYANRTTDTSSMWANSSSVARAYDSSWANDSYESSMLETSSADEPSSRVEHEWSESEDEAKARALKYSFDTVMVFKDGTEQKLNIDFDHALEKGYNSYCDSYKKTLSREEADKMFAELGKSYLDVDRVEYRVKFSNSAETNYSDEYRLQVYISAYTASLSPTTYSPIPNSTIVTPLDTTTTLDYTNLSESIADTYDNLEFNFSISYSGAKIYIPTEAHKRAMLVKFDPSLAVKLKDGTLIPVNDAAFTETEGTCENYYYKVEFKPEELKKIITDAGKDPMDFYCFVGYLTPKYPTNSGISYDSVMENSIYFCDLSFKLKPEYQRSSSAARGYKTRSMDFSKVPIEVGESLPIDDYVGYYEKPDESSRPSQWVQEQITLDHVESVSASISIAMHNAEIGGESDTDSSKPDDSTSSKPDDTSSKPDESSSKPDEDTSKSDDNSDVKLGDINGDGVTNVSDISMLAAHVKGKKDMYAEQQKYADINGDGRINVSDIALVAKIVKGLS